MGETHFSFKYTSICGLTIALAAYVEQSDFQDLDLGGEQRRILAADDEISTVIFFFLEDEWPMGTDADDCN